MGQTPGVAWTYTWYAMRRLSLIFVLFLLCGTRLWAQTDEIQQLLLNVEKLAQHRQILADMKKGYALVTTGYRTIRDANEGNFSLHHGYLEGLLGVSPAVRQYRRVGEILSLQATLLQESGKALRGAGRGGTFSPEEVRYLDRVYGRMLRHSLDQLETLTGVLTTRQLRMSEEERLQAIDAIWREMQELLLAQRDFNRSLTVLAWQRTREGRRIAGVREIYGMTP